MAWFLSSSPPLAHVSTALHPCQVNLNTVLDSFAACIGAMTDMVAQHTQLRIRARDGCTVQRLIGCAYEWSKVGGVLVVKLGEVRQLHWRSYPSAMQPRTPHRCYRAMLRR